MEYEKWGACDVCINKDSQKKERETKVVINLKALNLHCKLHIM